MAVSITQQNRVDVSNLYVALFGRAPDGEGLGYWSGLLAAGQTPAQIADIMFATAPARTYYPSFFTNEQIIASVYLNVLGRVADTDGLNYWTGKLNAPTATKGSVIAEMVAVVVNYTGTDPAGLASKALFAAKADVALYTGLQNASVAVAQSALSGVTADPATVATAKAAVDAAVVAATNVAPAFVSGATGTVAENAATSTVVYKAITTDANAGDTATYSLKAGVGDASMLSINATTGEVTLLASANFEAKAAYTFTVVATDSKGWTTEKAVAVAVTDVNEAPVAGTATSASVAENSTVVGTFAATDVDAGDALTYALSGADAALFDITAAGAVSFKVAPNFEVDAKTYAINVVATDKAGLTSTQALTVNVTDVNEAPTSAATATASVAENSTAVGTFAAADVDAGDVQTYTLTGTDAALFGVDAAGAVSFKVAPNFEVDAKAYSLNVVATDKGGLSTTQAVSVAVTNVNEAPTAVADTLATQALASNNTYVIDITTVTANDSDVDAGDVISIASVSDRTDGAGTVSLNGGTKVVYIANNSSVREGSFDYTIKDAGGLTATAKASFIINSAPVGTAGAATLAEDAVAVAGTVVAVDANSDAMTYALGTTVANGALVFNANGSYTYTPTANFNGTDSFTFTATDSYGATSAAATVTLTVTPVNDAPTTANQTVNVVAGSSVNVVTVTASDVDTIAALNNPVTDVVGYTNTAAGVGTVTGAAGVYNYATAAGQMGGNTDTFTVTATDTAAATGVSTITVNITNNVATVAADGFGTGNANNANAYLSKDDGTISTTTVAANGALADKIVSGQSYFFDVLANDDDGDAGVTQSMALVPTGLTQPAQGGLVEVVTVAGKNYVKFTSTPGYSGAVTFTYQARDIYSTDAQAVTGAVSVNVGTQLGGTTGADLLVGSSAAETLNGGAGNDTIDGGSGADQVDGGADNDIITFRNTETNITGNTGVDTLVLSATNNNTTQVNLSSGAGQTVGPTTTVTGFENLDASAISQNLAVTDSVVTTLLKTGSGADAITLNNSAAILVDAGAANDVINIAPANLSSADSLGGGTGTDQLVFNAVATNVADGQFTNVTSIETLKLANADNAQNVTLGTEAQEAGIVTVDLTAVAPTAAAGIVVNAGGYAVTGGITFLASAGSSADQTLTGGAGNDVFSFNTAVVIDTNSAGVVGAGSVDVVMAGGTGTDTISLGNDANGDQIGNAVQIDLDAGVSGIEIVKVSDTAVDNIAGDVTVSFAGGYAQTTTLTIDGSELDAGETLLVNAAANATNESLSVIGGAGDDVITADDAANTIDGGAGADTITVDSGANSIKGGEGADLITIGAGANTVSGGGGDDKVTVGGGNQNLSGDAGNDGFTVDVDDLTSADTIVGGDGTDSIIFIDANDDLVTDAQFTNVTLVENITLNTNAVTSGVTLGTEAQEAGIVTVTSAATAQNDIITLHNGGVNVINASGNDSITGGTGNDSVTVVTTQFDAADTLAGGMGTDSIVISNTPGDALVTIGTSVTGVENVTVSDATTGTDGDVTVEFAGGYAQTTITIDGSGLDSSEVLQVTASNNVAAENVVATGGAANDVFIMGAGSQDNLTGGAGGDVFTFLTADLTSADSITGGDGTDVIQVRDLSDLVDADFTNVATVEVVAFMSNGANLVTLGAEAQAAGIVTVDAREPSGSHAQKVDASAYTTGITMFLNEGGAASMDTLIGGSGNDTFVTDGNNMILVDDVLTGNTGTDTIVMQNDVATTYGTGSTAPNGAQTGVDVLATLGAGITGIEKIVIDDMSTNGSGDITVSFGAGYAQASLTIDASVLDAGETLLVTATNNAAAEGLTVLGGADADIVVLGAGSDNVSGNAGNDTINLAVANLASSDTIDGGAGTDILSFATFAATNITDDIFTNVTTVETAILSSAAAGATVSYVFGAQAQEAGITTITGGADVDGSGDVTIDASAMTSALTINVSAGSHDYTIAAGSGNDTITFGAGGNSNDDFVQGGSGGDAITLGAGTSQNTTLRVNLNSDVASGTTLTNADVVTNFVEGAAGNTTDIIEFVGTTLQSGGGGLNPLSTTTDNFTLASDVFQAASLAELATFATGGVSSAYVVMIDDALTDATVTAALNTQAGVDQAVAFLTANGIAATAVANTQVVLGVTDSANTRTALFLYSEGASDAGIQASELKLIGVYDVAGFNGAGGAAALHIDNLI